MKINASFFVHKKDICCALLYNQFTTKIMLKKAMQMSQNHFILAVLEIKDPNIKIQTVREITAVRAHTYLTNNNN